MKCIALSRIMRDVGVVGSMVRGDVHNDVRDDNLRNDIVHDGDVCDDDVHDDDVGVWSQ